MRTNNAFPWINNRRVALAITIIAVLLLVSGCSTPTGTIESDTPGIFNHYIIYPLSTAIQYLAGVASGSYGIAIIIITLLIRLVLLPLMMRQYRSQARMRSKMAVLQPEMKALQEKYKNKTDEASKMKMQQEMMALYQKHQVNPLAIGCLPMLLQIPILTGLYSAIRLTPEIAEHSFLWFQLGSPDKLLPILAAGVYLLQFKVTQKQQQQTTANEAQQKQMAIIGYLMPIMMGIFALTAPAAISLYWVVSGLFVIAQSYLAHKIYAQQAPIISEAVSAPSVKAKANGRNS